MAPGIWLGCIFANLFRTEEMKREFSLGMHGYGQISSPQVVTAFDLSRFQRLADLGGATGHLAIAACWKLLLLPGDYYFWLAVVSFFWR
jgi:O-methyltransferase